MNNKYLIVRLIFCLSATIFVMRSMAQEQLTEPQIDAAADRISNGALGEVRRFDFAPYTGSQGTLIAEGDSWFDYPFYDVLKILEGRYQYKIESTSHKGDTLDSMVYETYQLAGVALKMSQLADLKIQPKAILFSGGGNDIAGAELGVLLNHALSGIPILNESVVHGVIDVRLRTSYRTYIKAVNKLSLKYFRRVIPILIHGYDYAVPDGRGFLGGGWFLPGPWLKPSFDQKGLAQLQQNTQVIHALEDRFNAVLATIPNEPGYENVCYVRVIGTLSSDLNSYEGDWGNELHPTRTGFEKVAAKFRESLSTCAARK